MKNELEDFAGKFANSLKLRNLDKQTVKESIRKLRCFFDYLATQGITRIDGIAKETLRDYQTHLYQAINQRGRPNSVAYQNCTMGALKLFTRFLKDNDYIVSDPGADIAYAKTPKRLPGSILTASEARRIINAPDTKSVIGYRDRAIMEVLYSTGIRKAELRNLTIHDVDCHDGLLRINQGKGKKDRVVPLGRIACRYLENYIKSVRPELIRDPYNNTLFLTYQGRRPSQTAILDLVKKYARLSSIKKNVHCHTFRHSCATAMLRNKANIRVIQEMLGHASLNSTQVYTHVSITDLKEVHQRCHPREKDRE